ncbi:hypothetical protein [Paenibacillus foliorum]|uniref:hypothetical protein n=1 Tax=Paenibacillus foliorum TaxID=2654974 RepID=UPI001C122D32|nr:hypothetical protein [Paenibacillus foliorum]
MLSDEMIRDDLIKTFHRLFDLKVLESTPIKRGWLNLKWKVATDSGQFLLKQYNKKRYKLYNPEELLFAFSQQVRLFNQGLACPNMRIFIKKFDQLNEPYSTNALRYYKYNISQSFYFSLL